jgi:hypothetical protein
MKKKHVIYLVALIFQLLATNTKAQCNLICNGGFEDPFYNNNNPAPQSSYFLPITLQNPVCWNSNGTYPNISGNVLEWWYNAANMGFTSFGGSQWIELNANGWYNAYQNFFVTGNNVNLTIAFAHMGRYGIDQMKVEIGPMNGSMTNLGTYTDNNNFWGAYSAAYTTGTQGWYTIKFTPLTTQDNWAEIGNFIDEVKVIRNSSLCNFSVTPTITQPNCNSNNNSVSLTPSNGNLSYTYQWSSTGSGSSASNLPPGVYNVTVTATCSCATIPVTTQFTINPAPPHPTLTAAVTPTSRCEGTPVTLSATGANTYVWNPGGIGGSPVIVNPLTPTVYTVTGTNSYGCTGTATVFVPAPLPNPTVTVVQNPTVHCAGHSVTLTASGASTYIWYGNGETGNTLVVNPSVGTWYNVVGTSTNGCQHVVSTYVGPPLPNPTISVTSPTRCAGIPVNMTASGASTYVWQAPPFSGNPYSVNPPGAATYTVIGTAANGCTASTVYNLPAPVPNPTVSISASSTIACEGFPALLTANSATGMVYTWWPGGATTNTISVTPTVTTTYYVFVSNTVTGCQGSATIQITPGLVVLPTVNNMTICNNAVACVTLSANTSYTGTPVTYNWTNVGYGQSVVACPTVTTIYTVTASHPAGCPGTATLGVTVYTNCCSQPTTCLQPLTSLSGPLTPGSYFVNSNITLSNSSTLQNCELLFMPNTKIIVPSGMNLTLDNSHLFACGIRMWDGIEIKDGGRIVANSSSGNSMIEDAKVAIDLGNISLTNSSPNAPIEIDNVIFNRNHIGIKIHQGDVNLSTLQLGIHSCVFSSRLMSFSTCPNPMSWPSTAVSALRAAASPTTDLPSPYDLQGFPQANLKAPYSNQPAHIGIQIEDVGNNPGAMPPSAGVVIGSLGVPNWSEFNLFDGLGKGIEVTDAGLSTFNNVFQDMQYYPVPNFGLFGGTGIDHSVNTDMNAMLNLSPPPAYPVTDYGNRFWNCYTGVQTMFVYDVDVKYNIFRSTRNVGMTNFAPGSYGLKLFSNRFLYSVKYNEFNDLEYSIWMQALSNTYDIYGTGAGTYADNVEISENYIGADVNSTNMLFPGTWSSNYAITLDGMGSGMWNIVGNCKIISNKINRAFRGISVDRFDSYPIEIGGNEIYVIDDMMHNPLADQFGILAQRSLDNMFINKNEVRGEQATGPGNWNQRMKLIRSWDNQSMSNNQSPIITCNNTYDAFVGFEFQMPQPNTVWTGNTMFQKMERGLELTQNGQIGVQGSSSAGCGDMWDDNGYTAPFDWASNWHTWVAGGTSAFPNSYLWCTPTPALFWPANNGGPGGPFQFGQDIGSVRSAAPCAYPINYPSTPSWRTANVATGINENTSTSNMEVYPNPTDGLLYIKSTTTGMIDVRITDMTGKEMLKQTVAANGSIDISSLPPTVYFIEIKGDDGKIIRQKIVRLN